MWRQPSLTVTRYLTYLRIASSPCSQHRWLSKLCTDSIFFAIIIIWGYLKRHSLRDAERSFQIALSNLGFATDNKRVNSSQEASFSTQAKLATDSNLFLPECRDLDNVDGLTPGFFTSSQEAIEEWIDTSFPHYGAQLSDEPLLMINPFMLQETDDFAAEPSDPAQRLSSNCSEKSYETCVDIETGHVWWYWFGLHCSVD